MIVRILVVVSSLVAILVLGTASAYGADGDPCSVNSSSGAFGGTEGVMIGGQCQPASGGSHTTTVSRPTRRVSCGAPAGQDLSTSNQVCGRAYTCWVNDPKRGRVLEAAYGVFVEQNGAWVLESVWCPNQAKPVPTAAALRQEVLRLLPTVAVGVAWKTMALVNAETVLWAATDAHRSLGNVTIIGRKVGLRIGFDHANWDFGDGSTDTASSPGKAYTDADPCHTAQCADYYGHTYTDTGERTIRLTVAWNAEFSLDGGRTWAPVDQAPLTGPQATHTLTVEQARGILVPNP